ncbi:MAG: hypothetical protein QM537_03915 [Candidatus Symbiobacter sp.]|nr:hypothetical protein [Candidatus Symbiobacter sp.]
MDTLYTKRAANAYIIGEKMIPSNSAPNDRPLIVWLRLVALALAATSLGLVMRSGVEIFTTPLTEDGYYSLAVARSLAQGLGFTVDGIHQTNGFQPLFTFIEAGCYWLAAQFDSTNYEILALRLVTLVAWFGFMGTALTLGGIAADLDEPRHAPLRQIIAIVLYLGAFLAFMHHFNGLETGLMMFLLALTWRAHQLAFATHLMGRCAIGVLLGLLIFTRLDMGILVACYCLLKLIFPGAVASAHQRKRRFGQRLLETLQIGGMALLVAAPWLLYSHQNFGDILPSSGRAQMLVDFDLDRLAWMIWAIGASILPNLWLGVYDETFHNGIILSVIRGVIIFLGLMSFFRAVRYRGGTIYRATTRFGVEFALILLLALGVMSAIYTVGFASFWFYYRYVFPFALLSVVVMAWLAAPAARKQRFWAGFILLALAAPTLISGLLAQNGRTLHVETVYWAQISLVRKHVPDRYKVAAGQSGSLGYFRPNTVNLDGKVNHEALSFQDHMDDYLRQNNIEWFCDWPNYVESYLGRDPKQLGWQLVDQTSTPNGLIWQLWHRAAPDLNPSEK